MGFAASPYAGAAYGQGAQTTRYATATLTGQATLAGDMARVIYADASLVGEGTLREKVFITAPQLVGFATFSASVDRLGQMQASLTGVSSLAADTIFAVGTGTLTAAGYAIKPTSIAYTGTATLTASVTLRDYDVSWVGRATIVADIRNTFVHASPVTLTGQANLTASLRNTFAHADADLVGAGQTTADGRVNRVEAVAALTGSGVLQASGVVVKALSAALSAEGRLREKSFITIAYTGALTLTALPPIKPGLGTWYGEAVFIAGPVVMTRHIAAQPLNGNAVLVGDAFVFDPTIQASAGLVGAGAQASDAVVYPPPEKIPMLVVLGVAQRPLTAQVAGLAEVQAGSATSTPKVTARFATVTVTVGEGL